MNGKRLIVMAGGTGGHIFPGLAVAQHLMTQGWQVRWLGTADRMEAVLVPNQGLEIDFIRISGLRGKGVGAWLCAPLHIFHAWRQARSIIKQFKPDVVLGMGGYVCGPGGLAAWSCGVPVVLHEQNGIAGLTNRWLAKIARKVLQAFPGAFPGAEVVGNPVRKELLALPSPSQRFAGRKGPLRLLVIGGSQGARVLNQTLPQIAAKMGGCIVIWHQTGKGAAAEVAQAYQQVGQTPYRVSEFLDDMVEAYRWADIVLCRAGALTVSEVAAVGIAAIFVPFQHKDRQQYWNALPLVRAGGAVIFEQPEFMADSVAATLSAWDRPTLLKMAEKAQATSVSDATERVADRVRGAAGISASGDD